MSRERDPKCRKCRREGMKLFLKGDRCNSPKCAFEKRDFPPGSRHWRRGKVSDYGLQLREKQKIKRYYGLYEKPFRRLFDLANTMSGNTGQNLLVLLERKLDNCILRLGFAASMAEARQIVVHGHVRVNGRRCDKPMYLVKPGDVVSVKENDRSKNLVSSRLARTGKHELPSWLSLDPASMQGTVSSLPTRDEVILDIHEQLVVEFCSR
ncbi:MAG: 30S ribosomal protein S4 [Planctomycetes bacterium]|nr:30S ribosomal protein S4 [Planctomycetota bacterium]